jgi:hypothetical protein
MGLGDLSRRPSIARADRLNKAPKGPEQGRFESS